LEKILLIAALAFCVVWLLLAVLGGRNNE